MKYVQLINMLIISNTQNYIKTEIEDVFKDLEYIEIKSFPEFMEKYDKLLYTNIELFEQEMFNELEKDYNNYTKYTIDETYKLLTFYNNDNPIDIENFCKQKLVVSSEDKLKEEYIKRVFKKYTDDAYSDFKKDTLLQ